METQNLKSWLKEQKKNNRIKIKRKKISSLKDWIFKKDTIIHKSKNFFSIKSFLFKKKNNKIFQPLIKQKENGILGIIKLKKGIKNYYLLQSKIEPGNINGIQISPTVQATKSNYLRKHGGKKTLFLNYFLFKKKNIKIISKFKLSEQGSRFLDKKNWNIFLETKKNNINLDKNYKWFSKDEIQYLAKKKNMLNMDALSVFSCAIKKNLNETLLNSNNYILKKLKFFNKKNKFIINKINFSQLKEWKISEKFLKDVKKKYFSIFFIDVFANQREVKKWEQPIIKDHFFSLNGFIICEINNTTHYLLKLINEPGLDNAKYTSTIFEKNFNTQKKKIKYLSFFKKKKYLMNVVNSDEGGRFFKNQTKNIVTRIKNYKLIRPDKDFVWVSHNQIIKLISENRITIEARILFACYNIDKIY